MKHISVKDIMDKDYSFVTSIPPSEVKRRKNAFLKSIRSFKLEGMQEDSYINKLADAYIQDKITFKEKSDLLRKYSSKEQPKECVEATYSVKAVKAKTYGAALYHESYNKDCRIA